MNIKILDFFLKPYISKKFSFPNNNTIQWEQDFSAYPNNAPSNVQFTLSSIINHEDGKVCLRASNYGEDPYGCGAICVDIIDIIPFMVTE